MNIDELMRLNNDLCHQYDPKDENFWESYLEPLDLREKFRFESLCKGFHLGILKRSRYIMVSPNYWDAYFSKLPREKRTESFKSILLKVAGYLEKLEILENYKYEKL